MSKRNKKKLFFIQPPDYNEQEFKKMLVTIEGHFNKILSYLTISTPSGKVIDINLKIDASNSEKISAFTKRNPQDPAVYEITMNAGMSYHLWGWSRAFAFDKANLLPWIMQCKINHKILKKKYRKKEMIADYAYFISSYFILLHEISHILLGHADFIVDEIDRKERNSPKTKRIKKAFEAEADRQAGELLLCFFENSLGKNSLGGYLLFPSRLHAYEFYVYAITIAIRLLQDLSQKEDGIHPRPNERLYTLIGSLSKYFSQNLPDEHDKIYHHAVKSCLEAGKKLSVIDSYDYWTVIQNAQNLAFVDKIIERKNLRSYQHKLEVIDTNQY